MFKSEPPARPPVPPDARPATWTTPSAEAARSTRVALRVGLPALIVLTRPRQWYKNLVLFVPLVFSNNVLNGSAWAPALVAVAAFCLLSGATYAVNDVVDRHRDRAHPSKSLRPVAVGHVPVAAALGWSTVLAAGGMALLAQINPATFALGGAYLVLQSLYNAALKHLFLWDVLAIAIGFVVRALAGTTAIAVGDPTVWLIVCTFLFALYLALAKRRSELVHTTGNAHRPVLADYDGAFLEQTMMIATALLLMSYSLYSFFGPTPWMMITLPFAYYGVFRHNRLRMQGRVRDEAELLLVDRATLGNGVAWFLVVVLVLQGVPAHLFAWLEALA